MNKDVEQALFDHVAQKPDLSVDDMLWWLYDNYKLVVGTRTIRRAFERRNTSHKKFRNDARKDMRIEGPSVARDADEGGSPANHPHHLQAHLQEQLHHSHPQLPEHSHSQLHDHMHPHVHGQPHGSTDSQSHTNTQSIPQPNSNATATLDHVEAQAQPQASSMTHAVNTYQSPYAPMAPVVANSNAQDISPELARALGGLTQSGDANIHPDLMQEEMDLSEDEESLQLQLQQIALQKRELELKLKMRRLQRARRSPFTPRMSTDSNTQSFMTDLGTGATAGAPSSHMSAATDMANSHDLADPDSPNPSSSNKHRDSRSKSKVEEARRRTEERQERMLKDLERRSRRREHLTAEWVQSRDVWAKGPEKLLVELMHQHSTYAYNQNSLDSFEAIFQALYQLVDHSEWYPPVHDDLLRERTRRKMSQLRSKMVKSGEIISRGEGYGGWTRADMTMDDSLPLDQQDIQHGLHAMSDLPLDISALGDPRHQPSDEAMIARDAMMQAPHDHAILHHQSFQQNPHQHDPHVFGQDLDPDFGQHQRAMQEADMNRHNAMAI